jgi:hypothetical protein
MVSFHQVFCTTLFYQNGTFEFSTSLRLKKFLNDRPEENRIRGGLKLFGDLTKTGQNMINM